MALKWQMFHGGPFPLIGIILRLMATIGVIGLSGMKFGTNNEWTTYCQRKRKASHLRRVTGAPNWKGRRLGDKSQTLSRMSRKKATDSWGSFSYVPYTFALGQFLVFAVCMIWLTSVTVILFLIELGSFFVFLKKEIRHNGSFYYRFVPIVVFVSL